MSAAAEPAYWKFDVPVITHETLTAYATASGDHNPLHLDPAAARAAGEPGIIAHGMLTMAYLGRLATAVEPGTELSSFRVRFVAKTPVGARVTCRAEVIERSCDGMRVALTSALEDETVTARGEATYLMSAQGRP
jgi:acyl dehydratase